MSTMVNQGIIFNIQRYAIHDGMGIRTIVFLKGCPLDCKWCANPEGQKNQPQISFFPAKCINCGTCLDNCSKGAAFKSDDGAISWNPTICTGCGQCVQQCYAGARILYGRFVTAEELLDEVMRDLPFFISSGGGVTLSGGEPLYQADFCLEFLKLCREQAINTAIETSGYGAWEKLKVLSQYLDTILYDLKHMDSEIHKEITGLNNNLIISNLKKLAKEHQNIIIRVPIIPGINDSEEHIYRLAEFVISLKTVKTIELLPFHKLGENKYLQLGMPYNFGPQNSIKPAEIEHLKKTIENKGLKCLLE